jgi:hypothetical protein
VRIRATSMAAAAVLLAASAAGAPASPDPRVTRARRGTVKVLASKLGGEQPGAAIMIGAMGGNAFFLTACHVVAEARTITIQSFDRRAERVAATLYENRCDDDLDLAVIVASRYGIGEAIDQIPQADPAKVQPGDRVGVLGHPPEGDWLLRPTTFNSITDTHVTVAAGVIRGGDSGGPLLNTYADVIGVNVGVKADGELGRAVRIDSALALIDSWRVPYKTRLTVDFCATIANIITWSEKDFDAIKGAPVKRDYQTDLEWSLRDATADITGEGGSRLFRSARYGDDKTTQYVANFGKQRTEADARQLSEEIARRIQGCLPGKEPIFRQGKQCFYTPWRRSMWHTPIQFVTYLRPIYSEVELIASRTYNRPYLCN